MFRQSQRAAVGGVLGHLAAVGDKLKNDGEEGRERPEDNRHGAWVVGAGIMGAGGVRCGVGSLGREGEGGGEGKGEAKREGESDREAGELKSRQQQQVGEIKDTA